MKNTGVILLLLAMAGCGFHLRGTVELQSGLSEMVVRDASPATDIAIELRRSLIAQGVQISDVAPVVLQLHGESYGKRVLSVDSEGRAKEYGLSYVVTFSVHGTDGAVWISRESVSANRDLQFDATAVLGSSSEETQLRKEMRQDAVTRIMRRLQNARPPAE